MTHRFRFSFLAVALAAQCCAQADPLAELAAFSSFKNVNLEQLAKGDVKTGHLPDTSFARGMGVEGCYVIRKPLAKTLELHTQSSSSDSDVLAQGDLSGHPAAGEFGKLSSALASSSGKLLVADTLKVGSSGTRLQVSKVEAASAPTDSSGVTTFWTNALVQRAQAFAAGGTGKLPPYETGGETIHVSSEITQLLDSSGKVRSAFSGIIGSTALGGGRGAITPSLHWEMFDEEGHAAVSLGASYSKQSGPTAQVVELQYYASSGFYALIKLYKMWSVNIGGQDCTLVWRGDLISSSSIGAQHGGQRMGAGGSLMKELRTSIQSTLSEAK